MNSVDHVSSANGQKVIRIGGASAFYGDSQLSARQLVQHGQIDYLVFDYLAETTMAILARAKAKNPDLGYAVDFVDTAMRDVLVECADRGIKVIANAGGVNVPACVRALESLCKELNLDLYVAGVFGDDLSMQLDELPVSELKEAQTGADLPQKLASINAYLGAAPIVTALRAGADIVVTGRVVDSAVVLAPLVFEYDWAMDDYDRLAQGSLAGHLLECGAQCTGGNYTDWYTVPDFHNIGYPIAETQSTGEFTIQLPEGSGGVVTVGSVAEQLLYEIGDPSNYLLPDVACDFSHVKLEQVMKNVVRVSNAHGRAPGRFYKICATWVDGFRLMNSFYMAGPRAAQKARAALEAWVARCERHFAEQGWGAFRAVSIEVAGAESIYGPHSRAEETREVMGKYGVHHDHLPALVFAAREMAYLATSGPPAMTGFGAGRVSPQPLMRVHSSLIDKAAVEVSVVLGGAVIDQRVYSSAHSSAKPSLEYMAEMPDVDDEYAVVELELLVFARSGDKGDNANIGLICRDSLFLPYVAAAVTPQVVKNYFKHLVNGAVTRYYLPELHAFNFYLTEALGGGGTASLRLDSQAKTYAQMLMSLSVNVPKEIAELANKMSAERGAI